MPPSTIPIPSKTHISVLSEPAGMSSTIPSILSTPPRRHTTGECPCAPQAYQRGPIRAQSNDPALAPIVSRPLRRNPILAKYQLPSEHRRRQLFKQQSSSLPNYLATRAVYHHADLTNTAQPRSPIASYQARQYIRMTSMNNGYFSQSPGAFTGGPQLESPTKSDLKEVSWFGGPMFAPPDTINSPPSTDSNSNLSSPGLSGLEQFEGTVGVAQSFVLAPTLVYLSNLDITAQPYGICSSPFNQIPGDVTLNGVAQTPNFDVTAHYPGIQPSLSNQGYVDLNVSEAAQTPSLDNFAYWPTVQGNAVPYPNMAPQVAERPKSTKKRNTYLSPMKICDWPNCGKEFAPQNSGNLSRHKISVHTPREHRHKKLKCQHCGASFSRMDGKREHIKRRHTG